MAIVTKEDRQDRQQNHQRVADGDPKPVQPLVLLSCADFVRAVFLQPRRRFLLAQAAGEVRNCCNTADISCVAASWTKSRIRC